MDTQSIRKRVNEDRRPYDRTSEPGEHPGAPRRDKYNKTVFWWGGKYVRLGDQTRPAKLFWLLASRPGRSFSIPEVQEAIFGHSIDEDSGFTLKEVENAEQNLRQAISRLNSPLKKSA